MPRRLGGGRLRFAGRAGRGGDGHARSRVRAPGHLQIRLPDQADKGAGGHQGDASRRDQQHECTMSELGCVLMGAAGTSRSSLDVGILLHATASTPDPLAQLGLCSDLEPCGRGCVVVLQSREPDRNVRALLNFKRCHPLTHYYCFRRRTAPHSELTRHTAAQHVPRPSRTLTE